MNGIESEVVKSGKDAYLNTLDKLILGLSAIIQDRELGKEPLRIYIQTRLIIAMLPNEKKREEAYKKLHALIMGRREAQKTEKGRELTTDELAWINLNAGLEMIGAVTDFQDSMIGMSKEKRIGIV